MKTKVIADNTGETLTVKWDGVRFSLIHSKRLLGVPFSSSHSVLTCTILNPKEMLELVEFAGKLGGKE